MKVIYTSLYRNGQPKPSRHDLNCLRAQELETFVNFEIVKS